MATNAEEVRHVKLSAVVVQTGYFLLHFLEMCVVMCVAGIGVLSALLRRGGSLIGYPELKRQFPELTTLVLALWLTLLMIA